jgi:site-specific recombinase XerD
VAGASAFVIQAAARHADVSTSQHYVSIANEALRGELDRVFGDE